MSKIIEFFQSFFRAIAFVFSYGSVGMRLLSHLKACPGVLNPEMLRTWLKELNAILQAVAAKTTNSVDDKIVSLIDSVFLENDASWSVVYKFVYALYHGHPLNVIEINSATVDIGPEEHAGRIVTAIGGILGVLKLAKGLQK